jgi:WD40 repeat protein
LRGHTAGVKECVFSEDGRRGLSVGDDNTICLWDIAEGVLLQLVKPDAELANPIALSCDGRLAAYVLSSRTLQIVDTSTFQKVTSFTFDSAVSSIALSPDHVSMMVGDISGHVHFLRLELDYLPLQG